MIRVEVKLWTSIEQEPEWVGDCDRDGVWLRPSANTGWLKCEHCGVVAGCRKGKYCKQPLHCPEYKRVHQDFVKTYLRSPLGSFKTSKSGIACREAILLQQVEPVASPGLSSRALLNNFYPKLWPRLQSLLNRNYIIWSLTHFHFHRETTAQKYP